MYILFLAASLGLGSAPDSTLAQRIEAFVGRYVDARVWSGAILVALGDSVLYRGGFGSADLEHSIPNAPDTKFPVASVTKAFTRVATYRLAAQGRLQLDQPIARFVPGFPRGDEITIRHLVRHRSGIPDTDDLPWFRRGQRFPHTIEELVDSLGQAPLTSEPGAAYAYSNGGYTVLARVLERATGLPFADVLRQWVFEPAGMRSSGSWDSGGIIPGRAEGYTIGSDGALEPGPYVHPSNKVGAGSAFTSVDDVFRFSRALLDGRLATRSGRDSLFGVSESEFGTKRIYLGGRGPSYTASIQIFPDDLLIVALGNNYARLNEEMTDGIAGIVIGQAVGPRISHILTRQLPFTAAVIPEQERDGAVGTYRHAWGFEFALALDNGRLVYVDPEHQARSEVISRGDGRFVLPWQWAEVRIAPEGVLWHWLDFPDKPWPVTRLSS